MMREYNKIDFNAVSALGRDIDIKYSFKLSDVGKCYVYEADDEVIGFIIVDLFSDRSEVIDIAVSLLYRNKKIGDELLKKIIQVSKENGCTSITLEVKCDNEPAIKLYKRNDFKIKSIRKKYYNNSTLDAYLMYREL